MLFKTVVVLCDVVRKDFFYLFSMLWNPVSVFLVLVRISVHTAVGSPVCFLVIVVLSGQWVSVS